MKLRIGNISASLALMVSLCSCGTIVVPDNNVRYEFLPRCLWVHDDHSGNLADIPKPFVSDYNYLLFTAEDGGLGIFEKRDVIYRCIDRYAVLIDSGTDKMTLSKPDGQWYYFLIDRISERHMTLFFNGKETEYISYRRIDLPDGIAKEQKEP